MKYVISFFIRNVWQKHLTPTNTQSFKQDTLRSVVTIFITISKTFILCQQKRMWPTTRLQNILQTFLSIYKFILLEKNALPARKLVCLRSGQVRDFLNLNYCLSVNSTNLNHTYFIAINTHLKYLLTNNSPYQSLIEIFQNILKCLTWQGCLGLPITTLIIYNIFHSSTKGFYQILS